MKFFFHERPTALRARMPKPGQPDGPGYLNIVELTFSGDRMAHIVLDRLARGRHRYLDIALDGEGATIETSIGGDGTSRLFRAFLDAIASGTVPPNNLEDARHSLAMLYACFECAADGSTRSFA